MSIWSLLLPVAFLATGTAALRLFNAKSVKAASGILGLGFLATCLLINSPTVYPTLDPVLGGGNTLYLAVQLMWILAMFFLKLAFVPNTRTDSERHRFFLPDVWVLLTFITLITALFLLSPMPETAYRVAPYRTELTVVAFTQLVNVYSAMCAAVIVKNSLALVRLTPRPVARRVGFAAICAGFSCGLIAFTERIAFAAFSVRASNEMRALVETLDGGVVVGTVLFIVVGFLLLAIGSAQRRDSGSTGKTSPISWKAAANSNVTAIRAKETSR